MKRLAFSIFICSGIFFSGLCHGQKLRCDEGVVEITDSKYEILHKCGEPTFKDHSQVTRIAETTTAVLQKFVTVEDWLYNFGPHRFVMVLTFENDKLIGIKPFGYGTVDGAEPDFSKKIDIGDPTVRLLLLYGPPSHKEERIETSVISQKKGVTLPIQSTVEVWTYNLGARRFMRIYRFNNGRLTKIEHGDRGF